MSGQSPDTAAISAVLDDSVPPTQAGGLRHPGGNLVRCAIDPVLTVLDDLKKDDPGIDGPTRFG
jgi:hypothetical protein